MNDNMMSPGTPISINYSDERLRVLVEEYITQQSGAFTLKGVCDYVLYWAMEEGKAAQVDGDLYGSNMICQADSDRVRRVLGVIADEGRLVADSEHYKKLNN